jgi:hypothetical protein
MQFRNKLKRENNTCTDEKAYAIQTENPTLRQSLDNSKLTDLNTSKVEGGPIVTMNIQEQYNKDQPILKPGSKGLQIITSLPPKDVHSKSARQFMKRNFLKPAHQTTSLVHPEELFASKHFQPHQTTSNNVSPKVEVKNGQLIVNVMETYQHNIGKSCVAFEHNVSNMKSKSPNRRYQSRGTSQN